VQAFSALLELSGAALQASALLCHEVTMKPRRRRHLPEQRDPACGGQPISAAAERTEARGDAPLGDVERDEVPFEPGPDARDEGSRRANDGGV